MVTSKGQVSHVTEYHLYTLERKFCGVIKEKIKMKKPNKKIRRESRVVR